ncbi:MAG: glycosyltransferase family 2 protein [Nitrosopumilus sp. D6]|nr:MAG: glycosyltransferase family 2 protein [Nitrosopumilus sp. D6]
MSNPQVSIIVPTYNESQNILGMLRSIRESIPSGVSTETIVVDDNSPDGTGRIVDDYISSLKKMAEGTIDVIHRTAKNGLSSAILNGIQRARGETIVVMDSDFSHPPQIIPKLIEALRQCELAVASRYIAGGGIRDWPTKRRLMSKFATMVAKRGLGIKTRDPMSGFFAFKRSIINGLSFDALGYKLLLEILVKTKDIRIKEIPYTFEERRSGSSKLDRGIMIDYFRSVWRLYRHGRTNTADERRTSVRFFSKAARFFTVGASGFVVNYAVSLLFTAGLADFWYVHASVFGIIASISSNFVLNKIWTFEDRDFGRRRTLSQYGKFAMFSSLGALVQLGMVFWLVDSHGVTYPLALILAIATAAFSNFVLNKKLTFKENLWD